MNSTKKFPTLAQMKTLFFENFNKHANASRKLIDYYGSEKN